MIKGRVRIGHGDFKQAEQRAVIMQLDDFADEEMESDAHEYCIELLNDAIATLNGMRPEEEQQKIVRSEDADGKESQNA